MNTKLNSLKFGLALGLALVILNLLCYFLIVIAGTDVIASTVSKFAHGIDLASIVRPEVLSFGRMCVGAFAIFILGFLLGFLISSFYNWLSPNKI